MSESTGRSAVPSSLDAQLAGLAQVPCVPGEMIVFPISASSSSLADLARMPNVTIERIGPDVVRVRRAA